MENIYVMSDIHGQYDRFIKMLKKINFSKEDKLYIIGDIIDRGKDGINLIKYIMDKDNIELIKGNHEHMMLESLFSRKLYNVGQKELNDTLAIYYCWLENGGSITLEKFREEPKYIQEEILEFLSNLKEYEIIEINNQKYLLLHAGLYIPEGKKVPEEINFEKLLEANIKEELHIWLREEFIDAKEYISNMIIVFGHTPTCYIPNYLKHNKITKNNLKRCESYKIYKNKYKIAIDCGCASSKGQLGCLRLNDMKEFYIK